MHIDLLPGFQAMQVTHSLLAFTMSQGGCPPRQAGIRPGALSGFSPGIRLPESRRCQNSPHELPTFGGLALAAQEFAGIPSAARRTEAVRCQGHGGGAAHLWRAGLGSPGVLIRLHSHARRVYPAISTGIRCPAKGQRLQTRTPCMIRPA